MIMYVDDNDIFVTSNKTNQIADIIQKSQLCITSWRDTSSVTGGIVRPIKCSWTLLDYQWNGAEYTYKSQNELPADIHLQNEHGELEALKRVSPHTAVKGLGVLLVASGCEDSQMTRLENSIK